MAGITLSGVGSGIDITSLVEQLVAAETDPTAEKLVTLEEEYEAELSALGTLTSALETFEDAMETLADLDEFRQLSATSSEEDTFTATADSDAAVGSHSVEVMRLAQNHQVGSDQFDSDTVFGGSAGDSITISVDGESLTIDLSEGMTLNELANEIKDATGNPGVSVTKVFSSDGSVGLLLTSDESGSEHAMEITYGGTIDASTFGFETSNMDDEGATIADVSELDAWVVFDGYDVIADSNVIDEAITGITLTLVAADPGTVERLDIAADTEAITESINEFVDAYNSVMDTLDSLSYYDSDSGESGALNGDSMLRTLQNQIRSAVTGAVEGVDGLNALSMVGVHTDDDGYLEIDEDELEEALDSDFDSVADIFASENGVAVQLTSFTDAYLEYNGLIDQREDSVNDKLDDIDDEYLELEARIESLTEMYTKKYTAMDTLVAELNSTGDYLTSALTGL